MSRAWRKLTLMTIVQLFDFIDNSCWPSKWLIPSFPFLLFFFPFGNFILNVFASCFFSFSAFFFPFGKFILNVFASSVGDDLDYWISGGARDDHKVKIVENLSRDFFRDEFNKATHRIKYSFLFLLHCIKSFVSTINFRFTYHENCKFRKYFTSDISSFVR